MAKEKKEKKVIEVPVEEKTGKKSCACGCDDEECYCNDLRDKIWMYIEILKTSSTSSAKLANLVEAKLLSILEDY